ncbi:MAG TPA: RidA family protein [Xanthomonadaceae bacterium]|nr:RidA family protein [Xanthomonadaceae bacterium]
MHDIQRFAGSARMSSAVVVNGLVFTQGITARGSGEDVASQTRKCLEKLDKILKAAGSDRSAVLKVTIWLKTMDDFDAMNEIYDSWVSKDHLPVRACVEARLAHPSLLVEIQAEACGC